MPNKSLWKEEWSCDRGVPGGAENHCKNKDRTDVKSESDSNQLISLCANKLGSLRSLAAFFKRLERLGVGTQRAELMAADKTWQNVLRSENEVLKEKRKLGQDREERTVRVVLRAMREGIEMNVTTVKRWGEVLIRDRLIQENKMLEGGCHKNLRKLLRKLNENEYGRRWREELE